MLCKHKVICYVDINIMLIKYLLQKNNKISLQELLLSIPKRGTLGIT